MQKSQRRCQRANSNIFRRCRRRKSVLNPAVGSAVVPAQMPCAASTKADSEMLRSDLRLQQLC
jgi:hypothetical protein